MNTLAEKLEELLHIDWIVEHLRDYEFYGGTDAIRRDLEERISMKNVYYSILLDDVRQMAGAFDNNPFNYRTDLLDLPSGCVRSAVPDNYFIEWAEGNEIYVVPVGFLREHAEGTDVQRLTEKVQRLTGRGRAACRSVCSGISSITRDAVNAIAEYAVSFRAALPSLRRALFLSRLLLVGAWYFLISVFFVNPYVREYLSRFTGASASSVLPGRGLSAAGILLQDPPWLSRFPRYRGGWAEKNLFRIPSDVPMQLILTGLLALLFLLLIRQSVRVFRRDVMNRRMKQVVRHYDRMKKSYAAFEEVRQAVEDPMSDEPIRKLKRTEELHELLSYAKLRFVFHYPRRIRPGDYTRVYTHPGRGIVGIAAVTALVLYFR